MSDTLTELFSSHASSTFSELFGSHASSALLLAVGGLFAPSFTERLNGSYLMLAMLSTAILLSTTNIIGPLRFANTKYPAPIRALLATLPPWSPTAAAAALVIFPWSHAWAVAAVPFVWQYTREHHREAAASTCALADAAHAQATRVSSRADEEKRLARTLAEQGFQIAAAAARDARQAMRVSVPDFYGHAEAAWSVVHSISEEMGGVAQQAIEADNAVSTALSTSQGYNLANLGRQVRTANVHAAEMNVRAKEAQRRVDLYRDAKQHADDYRRQEARTAAKALELARKISEASSDVSVASRTAARHANEAIRLSVSARTVSSTGHMIDAQNQASRASDEAIKAEQQLRAAEAAGDKAQSLLLTLVSSLV